MDKKENKVFCWECLQGLFKKNEKVFDLFKKNKKVTMKEAIITNLVDSIQGDIYRMRPGDKVTFKVHGETKQGTLLTKIGRYWKIKGDDGKEYVYMTIVRV